MRFLGVQSHEKTGPEWCLWTLSLLGIKEVIKKKKKI